MEFESKILSKSISEMLYNSDKTLGTAESCTGGRIAEAIIAVLVRATTSRVVSFPIPMR